MNLKSSHITILMLISAIWLSAAAAFYSITGLVAIFAAAPVAIIAMGVPLEVSKLVIASWLYRNWSVTPKLLKSYFVAAVIVLMLLTSMGIFGFLSKAHVDQNLASGDVTYKLSILDEQIKTERENIDSARKIISQLDSSVDQLMARSTDESGASKSASLRKSQAKDRSQAQAQILLAQTKIGKLQEERAPIAAQVREVEAEVGPIKYIAQLIYGQEATDGGFLEKAVRIVILMIVLVFDPLAVLMFIALNQDLKKPMDTEVYLRDTNVSPVIHEESDDSPVLQKEKQSNEIKVPDRKTIVEHSSKPNGALYHIDVTDSAGIEDQLEIKADHGMKGLETIRI